MSTLRPVSGETPDVIDALRAWWRADREPEPLVFETSGSTGRPKRVILSRRAVQASVAASAARLGAGGRWLLALPATYVAGILVVCRSLEAGHEPLVVDGLDFAGASSEAPEGVPLFTSLVPTQLHRLLRDPAQVSALRRCHTILLGGGPIDPSLRQRAEAEGLHLVATYGASETSGGCVYDGHPLDGVAVALATDGRIRLGGPTIFDGYADDPALTAETLVDGWYVTSDAGRIDENGRLQVLGRIDDVVVSGGIKVPLPAIAARLRLHDAVEQAEAIGLEDPEWGQRVVVFLVGDLDLDAARDWVAAEHPRTWAPRQVVRLDALPVLANGKVDREALRGLA